jgi:hypothetical protein
MKMSQLIYASTLSGDVSFSEINQIQTLAQRKNHQFDISGLLVYGRRYFLQCIEGPEKDIKQLYSNIKKDPRHRELLLLETKEVTSRSFENWSMHLIMLTEHMDHLVLKYCNSPHFEPHKISSKNALGLLKELSEKFSAQQQISPSKNHKVD